MILYTADYPADQDWQFSGSQVKEESTNFSQSATVSFVSISTGFMGIVDVERQFKWEVSETVTTGSGTSTQNQMNWDVSRDPNQEVILSECIKPTGLMSVPGTNITKQDWTFGLNIFLLSQIPRQRYTRIYLQSNTIVFPHPTDESSLW